LLLPPSQVHTPPRCIPQEPSRHWFSEAAPLSAIKISWTVVVMKG
jgi:hypothetical protein